MMMNMMIIAAVNMGYIIIKEKIWITRLIL